MTTARSVRVCEPDAPARGARRPRVLRRRVPRQCAALSASDRLGALAAERHPRAALIASPPRKWLAAGRGVARPFPAERDTGWPVAARRGALSDELQ